MPVLEIAGSADEHLASESGFEFAREKAKSSSQLKSEAPAQLISETFLLSAREATETQEVTAALALLPILGKAENTQSGGKQMLEKVVEHPQEILKPVGLGVSLGASELPSSLVSSSLPDATSSIDSNVVSLIDGEPVLIVENLTPYVVQTKLEVIPVNSDAVEHVKDAPMDGRVQMPTMAEGLELVGRKIKKRFGKKYFEGEILHFDAEHGWFKVSYADGDEEELDIEEVKQSMVPLIRNEWRMMRKRSSQRSADEEEGPPHQKSAKVRTSQDESGKQLDIDGQDSKASSTSGSSHSESDSASDAPYGSQRRTQRKRWKLDQSSRVMRKKKVERFGNFVTSELRSARKHRAEETLTEHNSHATWSSVGVLTTPSTVLSQKDQDVLHGKPFEVPNLAHLGGGAKLIGRKTKKSFGGKLYTGEIVGYDSKAKYYKVRYEDGDEEELEWDELKPTVIPEEDQQQVLAPQGPDDIVRRLSTSALKDQANKVSTPKNKPALVSQKVETDARDLRNSARKSGKRVQMASVSDMMRETEEKVTANAFAVPSGPAPQPLVVARFASANDAESLDFFGWGEVANFDRSRCPEIQAIKLLPTSSPVVHLAASRHHLAALTSSGQVWVWRCKYGNIHTKCNEWEHISALDNQNIILIDISGPDIDRVSAGYQPEQEDQVPDPFYLAAISITGEDFIFQGSQAHEPVHTYQYDDEPHHPGLRDALYHSNNDLIENMGRIVQVSVGMVEAADESPFVGYITDTGNVYIRSATRDYMEEVNLVTGYTGKPIKIQCGRTYHAIILTDDGRAWTWGEGYYPGSTIISSNSAGKGSSPFSVCQPAVGTLVGRKVIDVGCYGEDFIALTSDGDVHQWTHAVPNPAAGVYNVPATPIYGQGPIIPSGDKVKQVSIGAGVCGGITESGKVHTWRTSMKGGFVGAVGLEVDIATPLARDEGYKETCISAFGTRIAAKLMCSASSLIVVLKRRARGRRGGRRKADFSKATCFHEKAILG